MPEILQDELDAVHQHLTQQQRNNLAKMEKQGWEAADWKARALESTQKLAAANAQVQRLQTSKAFKLRTGHCLFAQVLLQFAAAVWCLALHFFRVPAKVTVLLPRNQLCG